MTAPAHVDRCRGCDQPTAFLGYDHQCNPVAADEFTVKTQRLLAQHGHDQTATATALYRSILAKDHARILELVLPVWVAHVAATFKPDLRRTPPQTAPRSRPASPPSRKWQTVARSILDRPVEVNGERLPIGDLTASDCRWLATHHTTRSEHHQHEADKWTRLADTVDLAGVDKVADLGIDRAKEILK